ncbi:MAG: penicillin-binding protein 2, partial [Acidobacteria bacterium]|nr:penicillin-binding protein 2 [Acidobacteriota bacterium]
ISNALKARMGAAGKKFKDNGWFAGVEPRRNPEIVVCVLLEEGEHGYLAARTAAKVIKAYVDKQRLPPTKIAEKNKGVEIGAVWTTDDSRDVSVHGVQGGRFHLELPSKHLPLALAAPGLE